MRFKDLAFVLVVTMVAVLVTGCYPNPSPAGLTPIPTLGPEPTLAVAAVGTSVTGAATVAPAGTGQPGGALPQGNAQIGQTVFTTNCSPCHGQDAGGGVGPALRNNAFVKAGGDPVYQTIANGRPGTAMPAWKGKLSDAQIYDVIAYLETLQQ